MCGIAGIISLNEKPVVRADIEKMTFSLSHRGPDGEGIWISGNGQCGLGHRRLSIIDLDTRASQPMLSDDGRYTLVFNGEIYNFIEIQENLARKGYQFKTSSDTEVLLNAWREWGPAMMDRLNGMWAIAIYDSITGNVFLARDRFGVKPLLYSVQSGKLLFASETRAFLTLSWFDKNIDEDIAKRSVFDPFSIEGSEQTIFGQLSRLPAGHFLELKNGAVSIRRWWKTVDHLVSAPSNMEESAEQFRGLFFDAVNLRMRSDVPIGTCLSGGFDSTAVVSTMSKIAESGPGLRRRHSNDWRHAFVATFPGLRHDESAEAKIAANHAGIEPAMFDLSRDVGEEQLDTVMNTMEDVFIGLPTAVWKIYQAVGANGIRVSIDGHGADEMIGGYRAANHRIKFLMQNIFGNASGRHPLFAEINDRVKVLYLRQKGSYFIRGSKLTPPAPVSIAANSDQLPKEWGLLNRRLYGMFHSTVLPTLLRNFDRLSMAHSVEVRMPFMDYNLVSYAFSLSDEMKANDTVSKLVARNAMKGVMPEEIRTARRKVGFGSQMPEWLNASLGQWVARNLRQGNSAFDHMVDRTALIKRVDNLNSSEGWDWNLAGRIWPYIALKWILDKHSP